jgi:hypothetical protein
MMMNNLTRKDINFWLKHTIEKQKKSEASSSTLMSVKVN